jgi:hypothetical protein
MGFSEYMAVTEEYNIHSGVELVDGKIVFNTVPGEVHEETSLNFNHHVHSVYGSQALRSLGSTSTHP